MHTVAESAYEDDYPGSKRFKSEFVTVVAMYHKRLAHMKNIRGCAYLLTGFRGSSKQ